MPYACAVLIGILWQYLHPALATAALLLCAYLVYTDSRE
jgi:hypothetical protein